MLNKAVYIALGLDIKGKKDILDVWVSDNEGAKFWLNNLTDMKNSGMNDMLIIGADHLEKMSEAIAVIDPKYEHQSSIVH